MTEATLLDRTAEALRALGLTVVVQNAPRTTRKVRADAWLRVGKDRQGLDYVVEVKRAVTPATLGATMLQLQQLGTATGRTPLLVTAYVTPPVGEQLRKLGQPFADAAGNAYLTGPGFLIFVTGRKPGEKTGQPRQDRALTTTWVKVMFALICDPELAAAPHRAIAAAAAVALGAVPAVLANMRRHGHLLVMGKKRRLNATHRLLDEWALAYARTLRPKTLLGTYQAANFDTWAKWELNPQQALWGGEPGANLLVRYLKPGILTIYADKLPARLVVNQRLTAAGPFVTERLVEVRKPFWDRTLRNDGRPDTAPPALVYADLLATGDGRCIEAAQMIYGKYLARLFPAA